VETPTRHEVSVTVTALFGPKTVTILAFPSLHDHRLSPRPPVQDGCKQIEDLPTLTASRPTPFSPFHPFELFTVTISTSRNGVAPVCPHIQHSFSTVLIVTNLTILFYISSTIFVRPDQDRPVQR
jgi:hypothetical protein